MSNPAVGGTTDGAAQLEVWRRRRGALAKGPGVAAAVRELSDGRTLSLAYVRNGPRGSTPVLVIPGGPGLASVMPYRRFRAAAAKRGLDLLMVEHRGVGMSRKSGDGTDLRPTDITTRDVLGDLVAVLDAEGIERVTVYGSSYGSYVAGAFGTLHPTRINGMILDSPMLDGQSKQATARELNRLYWHGTEATAAQATRLRALIEQGVTTPDEAGFPIQLLHESGGPELVASALDLLQRGKGARIWSWLNRLGATDVTDSRPFLMEFDLVARYAYTELGFAAPNDPALGPLRSDEPLAGSAGTFAPSERQAVDVRSALAHFHWPMIVLSGDHDLRTPRSIAEHVAATAPLATLVPVHEHGHSALDAAPAVALDVMHHLVNARGVPSGSYSPQFTAPRPMIARLISFRLAFARLAPSATP